MKVSINTRNMKKNMCVIKYNITYRNIVQSISAFLRIVKSNK